MTFKKFKDQLPEIRHGYNELDSPGKSKLYRIWHGLNLSLIQINKEAEPLIEKLLSLEGVNVPEKKELITHINSCTIAIRKINRRFGIILKKARKPILSGL
jgi:hypothetical protein